MDAYTAECTVTRPDGRTFGVACATGTQARKRADRVAFLLRRRGLETLDARTYLRGGVPGRAYTRDGLGRISGIRARDTKGRILPTRTRHRTRTREIRFRDISGGIYVIRANRYVGLKS